MSSSIVSKSHDNVGDEHNEVHDSSSSSSSSSAAASSSSSSAPPPSSSLATAYPMSRGDRSLDLIASTLSDISREEAKLKAALAASASSSSASSSSSSAPSAAQTRKAQMLALQLKMNSGRRANAVGVAKEAANQVSSKDSSSSSSSSISDRERQAKRDSQSAREEKESSDLAAGLDPSLAYMNETAAGAAGRKGNAGSSKAASFGWDVFNVDAQYNAYEKRLSYLPKQGDDDDEGMQQQPRVEQSAAASSSSDIAHSLSYATSTHRASAAGIDRLVGEMDRAADRKAKFSRRRAFNEDEDVTYVNERNRNFNKKAARAFEPYTIEIKQNIERGTAL